MKLKTFAIGGIHPGDHKRSAGAAIAVLPLPDMVSVPVAQHMGAPAVPVVKRGDHVKTGQLIARGEAFVSANIHSPVTGTVAKITEVLDSTGYKRQAITFKVKEDEWAEGIDTSPEVRTVIDRDAERIVEVINHMGIVGLGGAAFPAHVKLKVPEGKKAEVLLINGVECEPYLTADHRLMLEHTREVLVGIKILMKALSVGRAIIGIENNKADAIELMQAACGQEEQIDVQPLAVKYPQGGEKQLIQAVLGKEVPSGQLPIEVGAVVHNVGTAYAVYEAVQKNKPLIERVVTVTGDDVLNPVNLKARIGTPISKLIDAAGGVPDSTRKILSGGPMMGKALNDLEVPLAKATSGILMIPEAQARRAQVYNCVRCGKCITACPMGLEPYRLMVLSAQENTEAMADEGAMDCIECGSCSYDCPSNRPILDYIRLGKHHIKAMNKPTV